jgi:hypothetical protein
MGNYLVNKANFVKHRHRFRLLRVCSTDVILKPSPCPLMKNRCWLYLQRMQNFRRNHKLALAQLNLNSFYYLFDRILFLQVVVKIPYNVLRNMSKKHIENETAVRDKGRAVIKS